MNCLHSLANSRPRRDNCRGPRARRRSTRLDSSFLFQDPEAPSPASKRGFERDVQFLVPVADFNMSMEPQLDAQNKNDFLSALAAIIFRSPSRYHQFAAEDALRIIGVAKKTVRLVENMARNNKDEDVWKVAGFSTASPLGLSGFVERIVAKRLHDLDSEIFLLDTRTSKPQPEAKKYGHTSPPTDAEAERSIIELKTRLLKSEIQLELAPPEFDDVFPPPHSSSSPLSKLASSNAKKRGVAKDAKGNHYFNPSPLAITAGELYKAIWILQALTRSLNPHAIIVLLQP